MAARPVARATRRDGCMSARMIERARCRRLRLVLRGARRAQGRTRRSDEELAAWVVGGARTGWTEVRCAVSSWSSARRRGGPPSEARRRGVRRGTAWAMAVGGLGDELIRPRLAVGGGNRKRRRGGSRHQRRVGTDNAARVDGEGEPRQAAVADTGATDGDGSDGDGGGAAVGPVPGGVLRRRVVVLSLNVRTFSVARHVELISALAALKIAGREPDVIVLQETHVISAQTGRRTLVVYRQFAVPVPAGNGIDGLITFVHDGFAAHVVSSEPRALVIKLRDVTPPLRIADVNRSNSKQG